MRDQGFLLPPDMREWLPADHPVWLVIEVVENHLDTSAFHAGRRAGGAGAAGYHPDMLLTVLIWGYAHGITSSRRIEQLCGTDVAFRVICGGNRPDHATVARFRAAFPDAVADLFAEVLKLCARLGMGKLGTVALDGTKITASASKAANRTEDTLERLAKEAVAAHGRADAEEDGLFGDASGDEVPREAWSPKQRGGRIRAALAGLRADRQAAEQQDRERAGEWRRRRDAGQRTGCPPASAEVALAEESLARERAARQAQVTDLEKRYEDGLVRRRPGEVDEYCRVREAAARVQKARNRAAAREQAAQDRPAGKDRSPARNITDPDSRLMPVRGGGFIQGYNAQNVTSQDGLIIATRLTQDTTDTAWYQPMTAAARQAAALIGAARPAAPDGSSGIGLVIADAGYCSEANLTAPGPDRLIATGSRRGLEKAARDPSPAAQPGGPATRAMAQRLQTEDGITAYRQRGHIAETPHGHIKHDMGFRQLTMRGMPKAEAEWNFACTVHNLIKALTTGHLTTAALAR